MVEGLLGKKLGMTRIFDEGGNSVTVTVLGAGPCPVLQVKTPEKDGYKALQLGFDQKKRGSAGKPQSEHFKKAGCEPQRFIREVGCSEDADVKPGDVLTVEVFEGVKRLDVSGISKGRGFAGVVKRYGMRGGPASHGSTSHRRVGSIGQSAYPARVLKGQRMPGHMGSAKVTAENLSVVRIDKSKNLLIVKGSVPGATGGYVIIRRSKY